MSKYPMIKPGRYVGVITKSEKTKSVNNNDMIKTSILVPYPDIDSDDVTFVHENIMLMPSMAWRLPYIAEAVGCETDNLENIHVHMKGVVVSIEVGSESHPEYGDKNTITQWHAATDEEKELFDQRNGGSDSPARKHSDEECQAMLNAILGNGGGKKKDEKKAKHAKPVTTVPDDDIPF